MASGSMLLTFSSLPLPPSPSSSSSSSSYSPYYYSLLLSRYPTSFPASSLVSKPPKNGHLSFLLKPSPSPSLPLLSFSSSLRCNATATEYVFPDPIPEFADAEIDKFRAHLVEKLGKKKDLFGDSVQEVAGVCTEILSKFLHTEYGGPGTLLVIPFIDMADTLKERGLPGGPQAARAAVVWAQKHIDKDWKEWTGDSDSD